VKALSKKKGLSSEKTTCNDLMFNSIKWVSFFLGTFVTMPIVTIPFGGRLISVFTLVYFVFIMIIGLMFIKNSIRIKIGRKTKTLLIWFFIALLSSFFGLLFFTGKQEWFNATLSYIPKIVSFMIVLILISSSKHRLIIIESFFKGFIFGCVLNVLWACIEGVVFYTRGYSLNNQIFKEYIKTLPSNRQYITIVNSGGIRTPGFNYDPAHLGGIVPILCLYSLMKKKYIYLALSIIALVFSQSTTGLVSSVILIVLHYKKISIYKFNINYKKLINALLVISLVVLLVLIPERNNNLSESLKRNVEGFSNRVSTVYVSSENSNIRMLYHLYVPHAAFYSGIKTITGTGFGTASYAYVHDPFLSDKLNRTSKAPYDPESTYISYLFNTGIFGLLLYIYLLFNIYLYYNNTWKKDPDLIILATIGGIILSSLFYHYTLTAYQGLSIIMATVYMDVIKNER
jgi:hypothetical protein